MSHNITKDKRFHLTLNSSQFLCALFNRNQRPYFRLTKFHAIYVLFSFFSFLSLFRFGIFLLYLGISIALGPILSYPILAHCVLLPRFDFIRLCRICRLNYTIHHLPPFAISHQLPSHSPYSPPSFVSTSTINQTSCSCPCRFSNCRVEMCQFDNLQLFIGYLPIVIEKEEGIR